MSMLFIQISLKLLSVNLNLSISTVFLCVNMDLSSSRAFLWMDLELAQCSSTLHLTRAPTGGTKGTPGGTRDTLPTLDLISFITASIRRMGEGTVFSLFVSPDFLVFMEFSRKLNKLMDSFV